MCYIDAIKYYKFVLSLLLFSPAKLSNQIILRANYSYSKRELNNYSDSFLPLLRGP